MLIYIPDWVVALSAIAISLYIYGIWHHNWFIKRKIPFVKPLPLIGNMLPVFMRRASFGDLVKDIYNAFPNDKVVGFFNLNKPVLLVKDPDIIKMITVKDFDYFTDHMTTIPAEGDPLLGNNLISLKGDRWKEMRHTLSPAFTSSKMKAMFLLVDKCGEQMGKHLMKQCKASKDGLLELEMKDFYTKFTNDVIATSAFGIQCDSLEQPENEFYQMGKDGTNLDGIRTVIFLLYGQIPKIMQLLGITIISKPVINFFQTLVRGTIETREREGIIRPDMIHLMMQVRKGTLQGEEVNDGSTNVSKKRELTDADITAQAFLFFFAGFDTSSTLLSFMSQLLATHPDIQTRLQEEIDALLEQDSGKVTYEGILKLKYLDMIISESLRMWPPAVFTDRECSRSYVIPATATTPSVKMEAGDVVWIPTFALHRDAEYFPDPERFDPERFSDENKHNINPFAYMPFGVGPRACIGNRFALMEVKIAIVHLLSRFTLQVVERTPIPIRLDAKGFNMKAIGGMWLGIKPRSY